MQWVNQESCFFSKMIWGRNIEFILGFTIPINHTVMQKYFIYSLYHLLYLQIRWIDAKFVHLIFGIYFASVSKKNAICLYVICGPSFALSLSKIYESIWLDSNPPLVILLHPINPHLHPHVKSNQSHIIEPDYDTITHQKWVQGKPSHSNFHQKAFNCPCLY